MIITGTFIDDITYDIPSSNWTMEQWVQEIKYMYESKIDTIIFIRGGFEDKCIFPSESLGIKDTPDFADFIFKETNKYNINVYFGLYMSNLSWNNGDYSTEIKINEKFVKEVLTRYNDYPNFKGWYLPHEGDEKRLNLSKTMSGLTYICKTLSPEKKVMTSPFFLSKILDPNNPYSPKQTYEQWDNIFKENKDLDICAFQDGTAPMNEMSEYFNVTKKLCEKYNIEHWINVETFERDVRCMYYPITYNLLEQKLRKHQEYGDKLITFEFSHFLSPQSIYPSAQNLYNCYKKQWL